MLGIITPTKTFEAGCERDYCHSAAIFSTTSKDSISVSKNRGFFQLSQDLERLLDSDILIQSYAFIGWQYPGDPSFMPLLVTPDVGPDKVLVDLCQ